MYKVLQKPAQVRLRLEEPEHQFQEQTSENLYLKRVKVGALRIIRSPSLVNNDGCRAKG